MCEFGIRTHSATIVANNRQQQIKHACLVCVLYIVWVGGRWWSYACHQQPAADDMHGTIQHNNRQLTHDTQDNNKTTKQQQQQQNNSKNQNQKP